MAMKAVLLDRDGVINSLVYHENAGRDRFSLHCNQFKLISACPRSDRCFSRSWD